MAMPGRQANPTSYRYGFNGMEKDDEIAGSGNSIDMGARMLDTRLGRFKSLDPYARLSTGVSLYSYAGNSPILFIDYQGKFKYPKGSTQEKDYPKLTNYLKNSVQEIANNPTIVKALAEFGQLSEADVKKALTWGEGPTINVTELKGSNGSFSPGKGSDVLNINSKIVDLLENATGDDRDAALLLVGSTILHEYTHYGDDQDGVDYTKGHGEEGQAYEEKVYGRDIDNLDDAKKTLNEYNERNGNEKRYSTGSSGSGTTLPEVTITPEEDE
jgi:RHS repeat-associated protein